MQRRAAAIYFVFFLVIGAGAFGLIQATEEPTVTMEGDAYTEGDTVDLGDRTWTVSSPSSGSGELSWTNESAVITTTVDNGSEIPASDVNWEGQTVTNGSYLLVVQTEDVSDPREADFVEQRDIQAMVEADPALYNETITQNGVEKATYRANDTNVPVEEYFPPVERHTIKEGETLVYQGNETSVDAVTNTSVELTRPGEGTDTVSLSEGENFTVDDRQYFAHFQDNSSVLLLQTDERYDEYAAQQNEIESYNDRMVGLWGVAELSLLAGILLVVTAFLPVRG